MILKCRFFFSFIMVSMILQTSMSQKLDLSSLPAGVYIIKTLTDKGTVSHSLIKQ